MVNEHYRDQLSKYQKALFTDNHDLALLIETENGLDGLPPQYVTEALCYAANGGTIEDYLNKVISK